MAWGYEKCFVIEHDNTVKRRIDCKDCIYYESDDKSCMKRPLYLPVDGYNSWRTCDYFELDSSTSHYEEKKAQYAGVLRRKSNSVKMDDAPEKNNANKKSACATKYPKIKGEATKKISGNSNMANNISKYRVCDIEAKPEGLKLKYKYVEIKIHTGDRRRINVGFDEISKTAYINKKIYTPEAILSVRKILQ